MTHFFCTNAGRSRVSLAVSASLSTKTAGWSGSFGVDPLAVAGPHGAAELQRLRRPALLGDDDHPRRLLQPVERELGVLVRDEPLGLQPGQRGQRLRHLRGVDRVGRLRRVLPAGAVLAEDEVRAARTDDERLDLRGVQVGEDRPLAVLAEELVGQLRVEQRDQVALLQLRVGPRAVLLLRADQEAQHLLVPVEELPLRLRGTPARTASGRPASRRPVRRPGGWPGR